MVQTIMKCVTPTKSFNIGAFYRKNLIIKSNNEIVNVRYFNNLVSRDSSETIGRKNGWSNDFSYDNRFFVLKKVLSSLNQILVNKRVSDRSNSVQIKYFQGLLRNLVASIDVNINDMDCDLKDRTTWMLLKTASLSDDEQVKKKALDMVEKILLSTSGNDLVTLLKIFVKFKKPITNQLLLEKFNDVDSENDIDVNFNMFWCLSSMGVEVSKLNKLLEKLVSSIESTSIVNNLKLLSCFYRMWLNRSIESKDNVSLIHNIPYFGENTTQVQYQCLEQEEEQEQDLEQEQNIDQNKENKYQNQNQKNNYEESTLSNRFDKIDRCNNEVFKKITGSIIDRIKSNLMNKLDEFDSSRSLCNFIFYITSTTNNFTINESSRLVEKLYNIIRDVDDIKPEGLIQTFWSLQRNSLYPKKLISIMKTKFEIVLDECLDSPKEYGRGNKLSVGQISLFLYSLTYFNLLDYKLSIKCLNYLSNLIESAMGINKRSREVLKEINILWAVSVSNVYNDIDIYKNVVKILNKIEWNKFTIESEFEDLCKLGQIIKIMEIRGGVGVMKIPEKVLRMVMNSRSTQIECKQPSVAQDRLRRMLEKLKIPYESEYKIKDQVVVDFIINRSDLHKEVEEDRKESVTYSDSNSNTSSDDSSTSKVDNNGNSSNTNSNSNSSSNNTDCSKNNKDKDSNNYNRDNSKEDKKCYFDYECYDSIDFKKLEKDLVIEIDGPFHYNIFMDDEYNESDGDEYEDTEDDDGKMPLGSLTLILNGKTVHRNRVLNLMGYKVISIPWFVGYKKSFYDVLHKELLKYYNK